MRRRRLAINLIVLVLFVNLLTNAVAWTFHGEFFSHELDHHHAAYELDHHHHTTLAQTKNKEHHQHNDMTDDDILDYILHLSLHAAGQHQPLYFEFIAPLPSVTGKEILAVFFPIAVPESTQDSPFRPPRNTSIS